MSKEYIDREKAILAVRHAWAKGLEPTQYIEQIPAADVVEVRHGRWVSVQHKLARVCSVCNRDEPYKFADVDADVYNYCPNCGAKMDKEETNELD
jgi:hypothetical protein